MKLVNGLAGMGVALVIGMAAPLAWSQMSNPAETSGTSMPPAASAPGSSTGASVPGPSMDRSPAEALNADYVAKKIAEAKSQGKDVTEAQKEQEMGREALRNGQNDEAARHFQIALQAVGAIPAGSAANPSGRPMQNVN